MIQPKDIQAMVNTIGSECHPGRIFLFGSYATGEATS